MSARCECEESTKKKKIFAQGFKASRLTPKQIWAKIYSNNISQSPMLLPGEKYKLNMMSIGHFKKAVHKQMRLVVTLTYIQLCI